MKSDDWRAALGALLPDDYVPEPETAAPRRLPALRVEVDRRRKGKVATIITGFDLDTQLAADTAAKLKKALAVGGSVDGGEVLLQGDCRQRAAQALTEMGFAKVRVIGL